MIQLMREGRGSRLAIDVSPNFMVLRDTNGRLVTPTDEQRTVATAVLASRDLVIGVQGKAGTGKTFTIDSIRQLATRKGYMLIGLAPATGAVEALEEAGVKTPTVASVVLIGDTNSRRSRSAEQLPAVEAGSPFLL